MAWIIPTPLIAFWITQTLFVTWVLRDFWLNPLVNLFLRDCGLDGDDE